MGYSYYFLLSIVDTENYEKEWFEKVGISARLMNKANFEFPEIGVFDFAGANSHGTGDRNGNLPKALVNFSLLFPEATFAIYHFYWDCTNLTVYTVKGGNIAKDETCINRNVGNYKIMSSFGFENTNVSNNISCFVNEKYHFSYDD